MTAPGVFGVAQQALKKKTTPPTPIPPFSPVAPPGSTQFGPNSNLIGTQLPTGLAPDTQTLRNQVTQAPDRGQLAQQTFQQLTDITEPQYQQDLRQVGQSAAQYGRLNSGLTTSELGDVGLQRQKYLGNLAQQLSTQSAGQTLQDRLSQLGALSGLDQQQYQNLTGERGYQAGQSQQAYNNALAASGLTGPSPVSLGIAGQYGQNAQGLYGGAGNIMAQILAQYGNRPYTGTGAGPFSGDPSYGGDYG